MLIDTFINAIFLYDDKMVITFNYKEGTTTITFDDLKTALADQKTGSDLDCSTADCVYRTCPPADFLCHPLGSAKGPQEERKGREPAGEEKERPLLPGGLRGGRKEEFS